jgi:uncharacterized protein YjbI with pentapeptide repeats
MPLQMTSADYIKILLQGEDAWNRSRQQYANEPAPDLSGIQFAHADLSRFDLRGVVLQKAYLRGATLRGACLRESDLQSAYLIGADLEKAEFSRSRLVAVNLNGANLAECTFDGADMRDADCGGADLCGADFTDADLHGANLLGANIEGAIFARTRGLSSRQLMAARNWEKAHLHGDLTEQLDLPLAHRNRPNTGDASSGSENRKAADAPGRSANPAGSAGTAQAFHALECSFDPILG